MDEPLSNLDAKLRVSMRAELSALHARLGTTTIYVTHDQVEAMTLGQRVAVMRDGRIQQVDTPQGLYRFPREPVRRGVHRLARHEPGRGRARRLARRVRGLPLPPSRPRRRCRATAASILGIRPEAFEDAAFADPSLPVIDVEVAVIEELGSDTHVIFPVDAPRVDSERAARARGAGGGADARRRPRGLQRPRGRAIGARRRAAAAARASIRRASTSSIPRPARTSRRGRSASRRPRPKPPRGRAVAPKVRHNCRGGHRADQAPTPRCLPPVGVLRGGHRRGRPGRPGRRAAGALRLLGVRRRRSPRCSAPARSTTASTGGRPRAPAWARRLDHAAIFVFIAGTYTPFALLAFDGTAARRNARRDLVRSGPRAGAQPRLDRRAQRGWRRSPTCRSAGSA